jgi:hypothetical protein
VHFFFFSFLNFEWHRRLAIANRVHDHPPSTATAHEQNSEQLAIPHVQGCGGEAGRRSSFSFASFFASVSALLTPAPPF